VHYTVLVKSWTFFAGKPGFLCTSTIPDPLPMKPTRSHPVEFAHGALLNDNSRKGECHALQGVAELRPPKGGASRKDAKARSGLVLCITQRGKGAKRIRLLLHAKRQRREADWSSASRKDAKARSGLGFCFTQRRKGAKRTGLLHHAKTQRRRGAKTPKGKCCDYQGRIPPSERGRSGTQTRAPIDLMPPGLKLGSRSQLRRHAAVGRQKVATGRSQ
jgi:hypothetical protein